jgi:UDP-glucose 4-epimerase
VCFADASRAERELGWRATRGLEAMMADTWLRISAIVTGASGIVTEVAT